ncbi:transmembrane protein 117-like isoform X2 [Tigriopus californicus]|uniref:transmembrane protein 117-like isoform X2 n=1 Tax=Tigriopus californicus TaxID=6832 RepID=UPI0027DA7B0D|nr:transmembrane protein 117-like isoform X2 [Tigriopus californicus]
MAETLTEDEAIPLRPQIPRSRPLPKQRTMSLGDIGLSSGTGLRRDRNKTQSSRFFRRKLDHHSDAIQEEELEIVEETTNSTSAMIFRNELYPGEHEHQPSRHRGSLDTNLDQQSGGSESFCTRNKLERGTLSAFKRQARTILERDLPHVTHTGNIIRVWNNHRNENSLLVVPANKKSWLSFCCMNEKFKYYFQHPYLRLGACFLVILCNFLIFAEDPLSHSKQADIPVIGNVFSFMFTKYPPDWRWGFLKVSLWILAILCGLILGKTLIHGMILSHFLRLKMFRANQGSWMVQFGTVIVSLFLFSHAYNVFLVLTFPNAKQLTINSQMGLTFSSVMKAAACGTWLGDLLTALIITDMMLQDNLYPYWAPVVRKYYQSYMWPRILIFWIVSTVSTTAVITVIATDWITWDRLNRDFFATTELSRAFLASSVLVLDLIIVMQDWDFPHFTNTLDVNLPGYHKHQLSISAVEIEISGKWFNYGIIFLVMLFDLNMWKNQIFYLPEHFGQYTGIQNRVFTVTNQTVLNSQDPYLWTYEARSQINPETLFPYIDEDLAMHSRYLGYSMWIKSVAFLPCILGFAVFFILIALYGRIQGNAKNNALVQTRDGGCSQEKTDL